MLTSDQQADLRATGIARIERFVDGGVAAGMADSVWSLLARRGIDRGDSTTWPEGVLHKLQALRAAEVYAPFLSDQLDAIGDQVLGAGAWFRPGHPQALITFPAPGRWELPHTTWHFDVPARGSVDPPSALRLLGLVEPVRPLGGATLVIDGSHELTRRLVDGAPGRRFGQSSDVRTRLGHDHAWFRQLFSAGGSRERFFEPAVVDGVEVRVRQLTGEAGTLFVMHPWVLHGLSQNVGPAVRSMCSASLLRHDQELYAG